MSCDDPARARTENDLLASHFVEQAYRPTELGNVDVLALTPYQRALLISDGTVTRMLEAVALEPLTVEVFDQRVTDVDDRDAAWLDLSPAVLSVVRRRVAISGRQSGRLYALAESLLVPSRLPRAFISSLSHNSQGLGEVISELRLETRRELLWFGHTTPPAG
jgi:chorismate-pyruvate lyase